MEGRRVYNVNDLILQNKLSIDTINQEVGAVLIFYCLHISLPIFFGLCLISLLPFPFMSFFNQCALNINLHKLNT